MSKVLVIHPDDRSTDFLKRIYEGKDYDVINSGYLTKEYLMEEIKNHDRIIMMGHGTPAGLINPNYALTRRMYLIDQSFKDLLNTKDTVSIWCNSDQFFKKIGCKDGGLHTGMIISEVGEQLYVLGRVYLNYDEQLDNMNHFADVVHECIDMNGSDMKKYILDHYGNRPVIDKVTEFNRSNIVTVG